MRKARIYIDTSVFGGYFDEEFEEFTRPLFKRIENEEFIILFSNLTQEELESALGKVQNLVLNLKSSMTESLTVDSHAVDLANHYLNQKVVGKTSYADCLHIALATINNADLLIGWNFKHIVNVDRIRGYNSVNMKFGYNHLEIRSPRELINYEND